MARPIVKDSVDIRNNGGHRPRPLNGNGLVQARWAAVLALGALPILGLAGCAATRGTPQPAATQAIATDTREQQPTSAPSPSLEPHAGTTYTNETFGLSFRYPSSWYGPDVYEFTGGVRLAVGSDVVYPYGTGPEDRQPGAPDAYVIVIQYILNTAGWTLEQARVEQPWINDALAVLDLQDGESSTTARSLTTRVRPLTIGRFSGGEFLSTLSETAQTEPFFSRNVFLMDENGNILQITGTPDNVAVTDPRNWREAFETVDAANRENLYDLIESIHVE